MKTTNYLGDRVDTVSALSQLRIISLRTVSDCRIERVTQQKNVKASSRLSTRPLLYTSNFPLSNSYVFAAAWAARSGPLKQRLQSMQEVRPDRRYSVSSFDYAF